MSVEAVYQYEAGAIRPADDVALSMAEASGMPILCYWHMQIKSQVAASLLPEVADVPLSQAVIRLLLELREFGQRGRLDELLEIAQDGTIDADERERFDQIADELGGLIAAAMAVRLSREATHRDAGGGVPYRKDGNR